MAEEHALNEGGERESSQNDGVVSNSSSAAKRITKERAVSAGLGDSAMAPSYPGGLRQSILVIALMLGALLVALDGSIIATAIPTITRDFHSVDQVGWYGSAFFMCLAMFQGFWAKAYKYFPQKTVFLLCIFIFELGSLVVALAPNSIAIIAGRAVQGLGGSGVTSGCYLIATFVVPVSRLSTVMGLFGAIWACAAILGPVLGGVLTQDLSWRWCFWINLPFGGATFLIILLFLGKPSHQRLFDTPSWRQWPREFDALGTVLGLGAWICLLLVLQEGGVQHAWSSSFSIGLLVGFCLLVIAFILAEWWQDDAAMIPKRLLKSRTMAACAMYSFLSNGGGVSRTYTLPIYFQAVQGQSPSSSGVRTLPSVLSFCVASFLASILLGKIGYYQPFLWVGGIIGAVGSGLYHTLDANSTAGYWIGYQILAGVGMGIVIQLPVMVAQRLSAPQDLSVMVGVMMFAQFVGAGFGLSAGQAILNNRLIDTLSGTVNAQEVIDAGATGLRQAFQDPQQLAAVVASYLIGLRDAWVFSAAMISAAFVVSFAAEWRSIKVPTLDERPQVEPSSIVEEHKV